MRLVLALSVCFLASSVEADLNLPRKGYQCDWHPWIGRIA